MPHHPSKFHPTVAPGLALHYRSAPVSQDGTAFDHSLPPKELQMRNATLGITVHNRIKYRDRESCHHSAVELAPLDIDTKLAHRHAQILHGQHGTVLAAPLPPAAIPGALDPQGPAAALVLVARLTNRLPGDGKPRGGAEAAHRVVGVGVARADAAVLVRVGGDVGDELLRRQREQPRQPLVRLRRRREARARHVVVRHGIGDLRGKSERPGIGLSVRHEHEVKQRGGKQRLQRGWAIAYNWGVVIHLVKKLLE